MNLNRTTGDSDSISTFEVIVDPAFMRQSHRSVTGRIHVALGDFPFPARDWNDFVVVVLGWWLESVLSIRRNGTRAVQCLFVDGPYSFSIQPDGQQWSVTLIRNETVINTRNVEPSAVVASLCAATDLVVATCTDAEWSSDDLEKLISLRLKLRRLNN